ncbi:MAG: hypothetical protein RIS94_2028 [Pseudomonadota bacterium]
MTNVLVETANGVATLTLNRPDQGNGIDMALADDLLVACEAVSADPQVRCVVLTGAGRMFCVGGDVGAFAAAGEQAGPFLKALADKMHESVLVMAAMAKPLLTVVNGPAAGAGLSLAITGDVVLVSEAAHFTAAYTAIGLTPDGGMSWTLPRLVGMRVAQEMILTNRRVSAADAVTLGLATRVVPADALAQEAAAVAAKLADAPTRALGAARWLLGEGQTHSLAVHLDLESQTIATAGAGPEGREGVAAFLGKRKPDFRSV